MGKRSTKRHRVFIEDARRNGSYLRATWHPDLRVFVLSTWYGDVCTGAVRLPAGEAAELVGLVADGLGELVESSPTDRPDRPDRPHRPGRRGDLRARLTGWFRTLADRPPAALPLRNVSRTSDRRRRSA